MIQQSFISFLKAVTRITHQESSTVFLPSPHPSTTLGQVCFSDPLLTNAKHSLRSVTFLPVLAVFPKLSVHKLWTPLGSQRSDTLSPKIRPPHPACHSSTDTSTILNTARQWCNCPLSAVQTLNNAKNQATIAKTTPRSCVNKDDLYVLHHLLRLSGN